MTTNLERFSLLALAAVIAGFIAYYAQTQPRISFNDGQPYDAEYYVAMAEQSASGEPISSVAPFTYRPALPYLVGKFSSDNILGGFRALNLLFGGLTLILLYVFLRHFLRSRVVVMTLILLYVVNPASPFRLVHLFPAMTDPPALFFVLLILCVTVKVNRMTLVTSVVVSALGIAGILFREIVLSALLAFSIAHCIRLRVDKPWIGITSIRESLLALLPSLAGIATIFAVHLHISGVGDYSYLETIPSVLSDLYHNPGIYPAAWLTAFGVMPLMIILLADRELGQLLLRYQSLAVFLLGMAVVALIGGFHTDRFVYWSYPVILVLFGHALSVRVARRPLATLTPLLLLFIPMILVQILAFRVFHTIPDDSFGALDNPGNPSLLLFSPYGESANLGQIYAAYMSQSSRAFLLWQYTGFAIWTASVLLIANWIEKSTRRRNSEKLQ